LPVSAARRIKSLLHRSETAIETSARLVLALFDEAEVLALVESARVVSR
jgi:hypothetical protein